MALYGGVTLPGHPDPENVRALDLLPLESIRRMMRVGIEIDVEWMRMVSAELTAKMGELSKVIQGYVPVEALDQIIAGEDDSDSEVESTESQEFNGINVDSPQQVGKMLTALGVFGRESKVTATGQVSTGKKELEKAKMRHPVVREILKYREYSKLKGTFCDKLPTMARRHYKGMCPICELRHWEDHWRIHGTINTTRTVPGRLSMKKPNLQQIPSRTEMGRRVREGFKASRGKKLVSRDVSQLHLRLIASMAQDENMMGIFWGDGDIHVETARRAFGLGPDETPDKLTQRAPSKATNFLVAYGGNELTLYDTLVLNFALADIEPPSWLTTGWCKAFNEKWFGLYTKVKPYFEEQNYRMIRYGITWDGFGRVRWIPEVKSCHKRIVQAGFRQGGNHSIIGMEAGLMKVAMALVEDHVMRPARQEGIGAEAVLPIHDELLLEVDEDWAEYIGEEAGIEMQEALTDQETGERGLRVPIKTDGKVGERWQKD